MTQFDRLKPRVMKVEEFFTPELVKKYQLKLNISGLPAQAMVILSRKCLNLHESI